MKEDFADLLQGSAGLLIAHRLKKVEDRPSLPELMKNKLSVSDSLLEQIGVKCTIFEREQYLNERGRDWGFGIYWAQEPLAECLPEANLAKMPAAYADAHHQPGPDDFVPIFNSATGEQLNRVPTPHSLRLQRAKFRSVLAEGIDIKVSFIKWKASLAFTD